MATGRTKPDADPSQLTVDDICVLIARCYHHKVAKISLRNLEISFDTTSGRNPQVSVDHESFSSTETLPDDAAESVELTADQEEIQEDIRLTQLMLDNPLAYEQEMIDANLDPRSLNARKDGVRP